MSDVLTSGLKGGTPGLKVKLGSYSNRDDLQLINRGSDCFVNSVIQLLRCTDYAKFLKVNLPTLIAHSTPDSYKLSKRLSYIYDYKSMGGPKSAAFVRTHVAHRCFTTVLLGQHFVLRAVTHTLQKP